MKRYICLLFFYLITSNALGEEKNGLNNVSELLGKNRIIIVFSAEDGEVSTLIKEAEEINDRDIVWFVFKGDSVLTNYSGKLSPVFQKRVSDKFRSVAKRVILIGKDGGIKLRADVIDMRNIYAKIDSMPMRRREIRDKR